MNSIYIDFIREQDSRFMRLRPSTASHGRQDGEYLMRERFLELPTESHSAAKGAPPQSLKPATLYAVEALHEKYKFGHHSLGITNRRGGVT